MKFDRTTKPTVWNFKDLTGASFARLTVVRFLGIKRSRSYWQCSCVCGGTTATTTCALISGKTRSCGCLVGEVATARNLASCVHGESSHDRISKEYSSWTSMKSRCNNQNNHKYPIYGGRGIKVCDRWQNGDGGRSGYECFLADMGRRPTATHSIDRYPDKDGNYEPGNCRWATPTEQNNNRSKMGSRKAA